MRLLITGGSGYVGAGVLRRAPAAWTCAATYLTQRPATGRADLFPLDVRDPAVVDRVISGWHPDVVIHTAAVMRGRELEATNRAGSRAVAAAAAQAGARLIHLSSDVIFDGEHGPYDEAAPPAPISAYGHSKAQAEIAVRTAHASPVIVRTSLVYGFSPMDPRTRQTAAGEMPRLYTDEFRCPIAVDDLADALLELATLDYTGVINIAGPQRLSRFEFGTKLVQALGIAPRFEPAQLGPQTLEPFAGGEPRPRDCTLVIARAQALLRTRLRSVDQIVQTL